MRIIKLEWANYRRIPDAIVDVNRHVVLVGPNDAGKSSVLHAIDMCLGMSRAQLATAIHPRDFTDVTQPLRVAVTLSEFDDEERAAFPDEIDVQSGDERLTLIVEAEIANDDLGAGDEASLEERIDVRRHFGKETLSHGPSHIQLKAIGWLLLPASRSLARELDGPGGVVRRLLNDLDLGADAVGVESALESLKESVQGAAAVKELTRSIAAALSQAMPGQLMDDSVSLATSADLGRSAVSDMTVTVRDGDTEARLADQSDGIRALSLLAVSALTSQSAKIVAIDEPETHLHVTAQRAVARSLQAVANRQSVISTHATAMIRAAHPADVVAFGPGRQARQLGASSPIRSAAMAAKYWTPALVEALTARRVLFVEGQSDQILCEAVGEVLGLRLDEMGVVVVELGGGNFFPNAYRLLGPAGFDLPFRGLVDEDKRTLWAKAVGVEPHELEASGFHVCGKDLEEEYVTALGIPRTVELLLKQPELKVRRLLQFSGVDDIADVTAEGLLKWCREEKVAAAAALAEGLTVDEANSLSGIVTQLRSLVGA